MAVLMYAVAFAVASCGTGQDTADGASGAKVQTFDISGTVLTGAISNGHPGDDCWPDEATAEWPARPGSVKSGVEVGGDVTVSDASGEIVGLGKVLVGKYEPGQNGVSSYCEVPFEVKGIPDGGKFYSVAVTTLPVKRFARGEMDETLRLVVPQS